MKNILKHINLKKILKHTVTIGASLFVFFMVIFQLFISFSMGDYYSENYNDKVVLREFPYPYRAALTISSDIDATESLQEFLTIIEFLNTSNNTQLGSGLNLEIGNSFFGKWDKGRLALDSQDTLQKEILIDLIQAGYIDFIHSYNNVKDRKEIQKVIDIITKKNLTLPIWVNHSRVSNNLGYHPGFLGDNKESNLYHADLTLNKLGVQFYWQHAVSGIVGQGRLISVFSFFDNFDINHPFTSLYNYSFLEALKYLMAMMGSVQYEMREHNELVTVDYLDDGQSIFEFMRSNFGYPNIWDCANAQGLSSSIREEALEQLIKNQGYSIIYTHFGQNSGFPFLPEETRKALGILKSKYENGEIYVTTSFRLLSYYVNKKYLKWNTIQENDSVKIKIEYIEDPVRGYFIPNMIDLQSLTFYTQNPVKTKIFVDGKEIKDIIYNKPDEKGKQSVSFPSYKLPDISKMLLEYKNKNVF